MYRLAVWTDLAGRVLVQQAFDEHTGLVVPYLKEGYYMLTLVTDKGTNTEKVLITTIQ